MSLLIRIAATALRYLKSARLILYAVGAVAAFGTLLYMKEQWIEKEVDQRNLEAQVEQLTGFSEGLPAEQDRRHEEEAEVERAIERASDEEDAEDVMPESSRRLYLELWGQEGDS